MTLILPTKADIVAGCDDGAIVARLRLAGVPFLLWYAAFEDDPACLALRGFQFGTYADDARDSAAEKLQWSRFTVADACAAVAEKRGTYIQGYNRIGKSHLAAAQVRASDTDCFWINEADFAEFVYASKSAESTAPTITDLICYLTTPVHHGWRRGKIARVIYDDACARMDYGGKGVYWLGELFLLIEALMKNDIALTVTSNADADTVIAEPAEGGLGPRVGSRMLEMTGDPLLLFTPEKKPQSGPPTTKKVRCTCPAHTTALPPQTIRSAPLTFVSTVCNEAYVPPSFRTLFPLDPSMWDKDPDAPFVPGPELRGLSSADLAERAKAKIAGFMTEQRTAKQTAIRGDEPEPHAPGERAPDGKFCWRYGAACRFSREWGDAERDAIHANFYHHLTPKAIEQVQEPQPETQES